MPVRTPTTFEGTVERLGTAIRVGLLTPGSKLPAERNLAQELGISRSTLREALTTLTQTGHLVSTRGRSGGTFVAATPPLSGKSGPDEEILNAGAWEVLDQRVAVEVGAVLLACERSEPDDLDQLGEYIDRMANADDFDEYRRADIRFHISLAEAARAPRLVTEMTEVQGRMSEMIALIAHPDQVLSHSNAQHRKLVKHLAKRDGTGAVRVAREHLQGTEHILAGLLPEPA